MKHADSAIATKVVVVEDQLMFEQLLRAFLANEGRFDIVASARSVADGIEACRKHSPDLLLLDLMLPDGNGIEVARFLKSECPRSVVMILSGQADSFVCPPDLRDQIQSVVSKTEAFAVLQQEITRVLREFFGAAGTDETGMKIHSLTVRERQIFQWIGDGMTSKEIAAAAFISPHTVDTHRKNIAAKLGTSAASLVRLAAMHNLTNSIRNDE